MARKQAKEKEVNDIVNDAKKAIGENELLKHARMIIGDKSHKLHKYLNNYPKLPFVIDSVDMCEISELKKFPDPIYLKRNWTPLEKILYATLWKDGKLKSIRRIIEGAESAFSNNPSMPSSPVVYHYFGRHLTDQVKEPIIDQHSIRAHRLISNKDSKKVDEIRKSALPTVTEAEAYKKWFTRNLEEEGISDYENSRIIDKLLFAIGAFSKIANQH
jgi:hypothetical protein